MKILIKTLLKIVCVVLCLILLINLVLNLTVFVDKSGDAEELQVITVWQIDSFEGGRGSRAEYIRKFGEEYAKCNNVYVEVVTLTADAARNNLKGGVSPDIISYGSGTYGLESYINGGYAAKAWCRGGYCLLSLETDDFSLISNENTVINCGKDNMTSVAALLCGLQSADIALPTSAYVKLINGEYKFLLGTQRDIVRLQTRDVDFYVHPITIFNDLYQNFSVISQSAAKADTCDEFIEYIIGNGDGVSSLCLFCDGVNLYGDELGEMEGLSFDYTLPALIGEDYFKEINKIVKECDTDKLKSLLKSL